MASRIQILDKSTIYRSVPSKCLGTNFAYDVYEWIDFTRQSLYVDIKNGIALTNFSNEDKLYPLEILLSIPQCRL